MLRAGQLIGKLKLSRDPADAEARAVAAWRVAAGKKIAAHARATALVRTSLVVEVEDVVWQRQLNTLRHFLVRNLIDALGEAFITDIDFRPMPLKRQPQRATVARPREIEDPVLDLLYRQSKNRNTA
ncbi:MAG TPA: DciA family protein [Bryobacteraceae bacterium]|nr:DciA family protein [Bryobacteraceae bacterium]